MSFRKKEGTGEWRVYFPMRGLPKPGQCFLVIIDDASQKVAFIEGR